MNAAWEIMHHPFVERIGWMLLHSLWQGALIGAGFALLRLALRKQSAQARYVAGCVCLTLMIAAPLFTFLMAPSPAYQSSDGITGLASSTDLASAQELETAPMPAEESWLLSSIQSAANFFGRLAPWLTAAWLFGVAISSCRLLRGFWWVQSIQRRDAESVGPELLKHLDDLRRRVSVSRPVGLLKSALVEVPTVVGLLRPVIFLPASTLAGLTPNQLEAILVHELAHVRRFDYLVNIFQCLIETVMFYHPVVWWISRSIREERENCCDDFVVKVCGNRVAYARALETLEGLRDEMPQLAFAASGGSLLNRVRRLLGVAGTEESMGIRQIGGLALLGIGLLFILSGIYLNLQPSMYRAISRIKVERDNSTQFGTENGKIAFAAWDPYFIQNVCEEIRSEPVLSKVVNNLKLRDEWVGRFSYNFAQSPHEIINILKSRIGAQPNRNTTFLEISCISEKPEEAKAIANAVAEAYRQFRLEQPEHVTLIGIKALEERLKEQEERVRQAQSKVNELGEKYNIPDSSRRDESPTTLMSAETLRRLEGVRIELEAQVAKDETLLGSYKNMSREKLVYVLSKATPDPILNSLLEQKTFCEQSLIAKRHDFGEEHPEVVKLNRQLKDLKTKIDDQLDGSLLGVETRLSATREQLKKLEDEVDKAKVRDIATAKLIQPYWVAKRKLEELERFSQLLATKITSENVEAALPKRPMVELMSFAETPRRPSYPNRPQAAAMILFGILLDFGGLRMIRTRPRLVPVLQPS